ncbi:unnamed protein product [Amoebophrya sp. A25]|nr:unnamed protein product [Amoebophrya sp. A25]|eukprot:GSA25T00012472001.1
MLSGTDNNDDLMSSVAPSTVASKKHKDRFRPPRPWGESEDAAHEAVAHIWDKTKRITHERDLAHKRFGYSARTVTKVMLAEIDMAFTYIEPEAEMEASGWFLENEIAPVMIDTWATQALRSVPKRIPLSGTTAVGHVGGLMAGPARITAQREASAAKAAAKKEREAAKAAAEAEANRPRHIRLEEIDHTDPEEHHYRAAKEVEDRRREEAEKALEKKKKQREEAQAAVEAQGAVMGKTEYTFDTEGNILWVELPKIEKLPAVSLQIPSRHFDVGGRASLTAKADAPAPTKRTTSGSNSPVKKAFEDGFMRLQEDRPNIADIITLRPGVVLSAAGRKIAGPTRTEQNRMTMTGYQRMVQGGK